MGLSDRDARTILESLGTGLSPVALDLVQAVARSETGYGGKWVNSKPPCNTGDGSNNWGAVKIATKATVDTTAPGDWNCGAGFPCFDEDPVTPHCFKKYATPADGARGLVNVLMGMKHVKAFLLGGGGSPAEMAHAMHQDGYFTLAEDKYAAGLKSNVTALRASLGRGTGRIVAGVVTGLAVVGIGIGGWRLARA